MGNVQRTYWDGSIFKADIKPPYDARNLWEDVHLYALVKFPSEKIIEMTADAGKIETGPGYVLAAYRPPSFSLPLKLRG